MFRAQECGLKPCIITLAKGLSSAYLPISAVMVGERVTDVIVEGSTAVGSFGHRFTYSRHPVASAVARETIAILHDNNIPGHVRTTSRTLLAGLDPPRGQDGVLAVRGR